LPRTIAADPVPTAESLQLGERLYESNCAACHRDTSGNQDARMPGHDALQSFSSFYIVQTLTDGRMALQGQALSPDERAAIAEYLTGQVYQGRDLVVRDGLCTSAPPAIDLNTTAQWNGWSPDRSNARFQTAAAGGITAANIPRLKLRWAYGLPQEQQARGQPSVVGERLFVGSQAGAVYALNAKSGCTYWTFQ